MPPTASSVICEREIFHTDESLSLFTRKGVTLKNLFFSESEQLEEPHNFKQGFNKFMADLSVIGNYSRADAVGGPSPLRPTPGRPAWPPRWSPCIRAERKGLRHGSWSKPYRN